MGTSGIFFFTFTLPVGYNVYYDMYYRVCDRAENRTSSRRADPCRGRKTKFLILEEDEGKMKKKNEKRSPNRSVFDARACAFADDGENTAGADRSRARRAAVCDGR